MSRTYSKTQCRFCGRSISRAGFAYTQHMRAHVRQGIALEVQVLGMYAYCPPLKEDAR